VSPKALADTWDELRQKLEEAPSKWNRVAGPTAAVIATLTDLGWTPHEPLFWEDQLRNLWVIDPRAGGRNLEIRHAIQDTVEQRHWRRASEQYCGSGLELGADLSTCKKLLRKLRKEPQSRGLAELIFQGAGWPEARRHAAGYPVPSACRFCGQAEGSTHHHVWGCTALQEMAKEKHSTAINKSQHLEAEANTDEARMAMVFWTRGYHTSPIDNP